ATIPELLFEHASAQDDLGAQATGEAAGELRRRVAKVDGIVSDHLADHTVPASDRVDELAVLILELEADPVVLLLDAEERPRFRCTCIEAVVRRLVERPPGDLVGLRRQPRLAVLGRGPDPRTDGAFGSDLLQPLDERIELIVRDLGRPVVVELAMMPDLALEP